MTIFSISNFSEITSDVQTINMYHTECPDLLINLTHAFRLKEINTVPATLLVTALMKTKACEDFYTQATREKLAHLRTDYIEALERPVFDRIMENTHSKQDERKALQCVAHYRSYTHETLYKELGIIQKLRYHLS